MIRQNIKTLARLGVVVAALSYGGVGALAAPQASLLFEDRTLDGSGNNRNNVNWGRAGTEYRRVAAAEYADGISTMVDGPNARTVSNRVFNDVGLNLFSENGNSQWVWSWGQFIDHDMGLRDGTPAESEPIAFDRSDPLEEFTNDFGAIAFDRSPAAPGTGTGSPRQQINTLSSFIDVSQVYGTTESRLEWLRTGSVNGNVNDNQASMLTDDGYLPRRDARGDPANAPVMELPGRLQGTPDRAVVAGDIRANENVALTAIQTLFVREHNRIVASLPNVLSQALKFEIARRVVGAEIQRITYTEFLPAVGISLPRYRGYNSRVDPTLTNEFATTAFRAHSMVHGEFELEFEPGAYTQEQLDSLSSQGVEVIDEPDEHALVIPLSVAFGNPDLLEVVGEGPFLQSLGGERQYNNDEQIDNALRSILFQVPRPGTDPVACQTPVIDPACFSGVVDLGAIDVMRGRDHGIPNYNDLRRAYGLAPKSSFQAITGEASEDFPADPLIDPSDPINDPDILDFVELRDENGVILDPDDPETAENAVSGVRRSPTAARLRALYGTVDSVDAFTGMIAEPHIAGTEMGELQRAVWTQQFAALRDGDRFYYAGDPVLLLIRELYGASVRTLSEIVADNTDVDIGDRPFFVAD